MSILLSKEEQGIVVFHILKSLKYTTRLVLCLAFVTAGFTLQYMGLDKYEVADYMMLGLILVFVGNLLMLVKGYNNKIKLDSYSPESEWVKTSVDRLNEIVEINKKAKKWDINSWDITNIQGFIVLVMFIAVLIIFAASGILESSSAKSIIVLNATVLFVPHWLTGIRRVSLTPNLIKKVDIYLNISERFNNELTAHNVEFLTYVKGSKAKMPSDVKMKVDFKDQPEELLGMYAQICMNNVQEVLYPYFYVVLVAKRDTLMNEKILESIQLDYNIIKEFKQQDDVDILVIRQKTTKKSGYHTNTATVVKTFELGLANAELLMRKR